MQVEINDSYFSGVIGQEYELLKLICPLAAEMSRLVGLEIVKYQPVDSGKPISVLELGGGTGITTLNLLNARDDIKILSVDNEPVMQDQAREHLSQWVNSGVLSFNGQDALSALKSIASNSVDVMASAYTLHNFLHGYRSEVITEVYRVLKPGGWFINGDRFALDDISEHTRTVQEEVAGYFRVLPGIDRLDILEHWIVHLLSDESENHIMRERTALETLEQCGFINIGLTHRQEVNALVTASKPL